MRNLTYVFGASGLGGVIFAILAGLRWTFTYPDPSQAIIAGALGIAWAIMSFGFGYTYERLKNLKEHQENIVLRLDSLVQGNKAVEELEDWKKIKAKK